MANLKRKLLVVVILFLTACSSPKVVLISGINEMSANEIISSLYKIGIDSEKLTEKETTSVLVNIEYMARSVELLKAQGLPSKSHATLGDVFKKEGMISTPLEEQARYIYALSQELESTLSQIDGVLIARVHLVLSDENKIGQETQKPSAAVFVKHLPELDPDTISFKIKRIVSRSVPGLNKEGPDSVSISFIATATQTVEIKWVDLWGFRMTEKSSLNFKSIVSTILLVLTFVIVVGIAGAMLFILKKRRNDRIKAKKDSEQAEIQQPLTQEQAHAQAQAYALASHEQAVAAHTQSLAQAS